MKRISMVAFLLIAGCDGFPQGGEEGFVYSGIRVNPVEGALFEVVPPAGARTEDYWCGASEFARRKLGAGWTSRIYVASRIQQSVTTGRRSSVQFTLSPEASGVTPVDRTFRLGFRVGDSMSVSQARTYCRVYNPFFEP